MEWAAFSVLALLSFLLLFVLVYRVFLDATLSRRIKNLSSLTGVSFIEISRDLVFGLEIKKIQIRVPEEIKTKVVEKVVEVPAPPDPREIKLRERIKFEIAAWPRSLFEMPKFLELIWLGKLRVFELVPVVAHRSGIWHFAKRKLPAKNNQKPERRPWKFWSYVACQDLLGVVVKRHHGVFRNKYPHYAARAGNICTFQVLDGANVSKGDLLMILAVEVKDFPPKTEKPA